MHASRINSFLIENGIRIKDNPAISPDLTLDFKDVIARLDAHKTLLSGLTPQNAEALASQLSAIILWPKSCFAINTCSYFVVENPESGDHALISTGEPHAGFEATEAIDNDVYAIPLLWHNCINLKNAVQEFDPKSTIFPTAEGTLQRSSLGIGARFTTLHWPAVAWAMKSLHLSLTANQNSIPRELVYDIDAMMENRLSEVPFPFIGAAVPEGHQGQSVQGMSHQAIITYLKYGFHKNGIVWGFNADHQPIGGRFDAVESQLVAGSLFASYITYDLSPELANTSLLSSEDEVEKAFAALEQSGLYEEIVASLKKRGLSIDNFTLKRLVVYLMPAMQKMVKRDEKYHSIRREQFATETGRKFFKELSIDELPGETESNTLAVSLALSEALGVHFNYVAPNIGFTKNFPYGDNDELKRKVAELYKIASCFDVSFGFHSGSGKSAKNYRILGEVTGGNLEIKTSGRYTYEMGKALSQSSADRELWLDWYNFTKELAQIGAFAENEVQRKFARQFIDYSLEKEGKSTDVYTSQDELKSALDALPPSPDHLFWFEYNFLYVLAADGSVDRLGDHSAAGYAQRRRFYRISDEAKLRYSKYVAGYILFLVEATGLGDAERVLRAKKRLDDIGSYDDLVAEIGG
ncbi:MAG: hypothetical protein GF398_16595 [Chitinivibrionales bacterium]|nr:hypothetical protein [Chitinivibrionales bacterium]